MTRAATPSAAGLVTKSIASVGAVVLGAVVVWGLRSLIVPAFVGGVLAYVCRPLVARLERYRIPRGLAVGLLLVMLGAVALVCVTSIRAVVPSQTQALELRVRALYALHHRYQALMGLDPSWTRGNILYRVAHRDLDPLLDRLSELLALTPEERAQFVASRERGSDATPARSARLLEYDRANAQALETRARRVGRGEAALRPFGESPPEPAPASGVASGSPGLGEILSTWMVAPLIFLFLLWDTGDIKRGLLSAVPNRFFEPALAVLADVDETVGDYVRGIVLECCALGVTVMVFIAIVGVPLRWAIAIGVFTGATNVIPYMGFAAALLGGFGYALVAEEIHSLLPWVTADTFALWVVVAVALAELLKNILYEPLVLGGAVKLHPLVVVIGVVGGALLFGPAGLVLAIPTITVAKVLVASTARHLTAYGLI
ncbi:MAG TPA: AI-2E family transporter [Methylomirabilota bacterium]|nr:AI-2E family transporter [Methylomirabilota bacterium]